MTGPARAAVEAECAAFNHAQSQDRIVCTSVGDYETVLQRTAAAVRAGRQPVLVQVLDAATYEMIHSQAIVPASQLLAVHGEPDALTDYPPAVRKQYGDGAGRLYGLPFNISTLLLYVNDDALARAGVAHAPDTWAEFEAAAQKLKASGNLCPFAYRLDSWWWLEQFSAIHGSPVASLDNGFAGSGAAYVFQTSDHRRMMLDLIGWTRRGLAIRFGDSSAGSPQRAFAGAECAMVLESSGTAGAFAALAAGRFHVSAHPVPRYGDTPRHGAAPGGAALWVLKGFDRDTYRAVAAFLAFVRGPDNQARFARATGYLPLSGLGEHLFEQTASPLQVQAAQEALAGLSAPQAPGAGDLRLGFFVRFRAIWTDEMQRAFSGGQSIDQALSRASRRGDALLSRAALIYGTGPTPQRGTR